MDSIQKWQYEISKIDEFLGKEPQYPIAAIEYVLKDGMHKQREMLSQINETIEFYGEKLDINSQLIEKTIEQSTQVITGTLEQGFNLIADINRNGLQNISNDVNRLNQNTFVGFNKTIRTLKLINTNIHWGFSKIIELIKIQNVLSEDIIQLLNIPDNEKQRKRYIEEGIKFFKKSIINIDFIDDSKEFFEKAYNLYKQDYFVSYNLGLIHLFSTKHFDIKLAIDYFNNSAKYAFADINQQDINYSKNISTFENYINPKTIAVYSYLYMARCYYLLKDREAALTTINKAYKLNNKLTEVIYDKSKYLIINGFINQSIKELDIAIKKNRYITLRVIVDKDFMLHPEIKDFLEKIKDETIKEATSKMNKCLAIIREDSYNYEILNEVIQNIKKDTFLNGKYALDILNNEKLFEKIKNENHLKNYITNELSYINLYETENSNFKDKLKTIKKLTVNNNSKSIENAHKLIITPFKFTYKEFPNYKDKFYLIENVVNLKLKNHIILENELKKILPKIVSVQKKYDELNTLKDKIHKNKVNLKKYDITAETFDALGGSKVIYTGTILSVLLTIFFYNYWIDRQPDSGMESLFILGAFLFSLILTPVSGFLILFSMGVISDEWEYYKQIVKRFYRSNDMNKIKEDINRTANIYNNKLEEIFLEEKIIRENINQTSILKLFYKQNIH